MERRQAGGEACSATESTASAPAGDCRKEHRRGEQEGRRASRSMEAGLHAFRPFRRLTKVQSGSALALGRPRFRTPPPSGRERSCDRGGPGPASRRGPGLLPGPHRNLRAVGVVLLSVPREGPRWSGGSVSGCLAEGMAQTTVVSGTWLLPRLAVPPDFKSRPLAPQVRGATVGPACPLVGGVGRPPVRPTSASHPERSNTGDPPRCRSAPSKAAGGPIARPHGFPAHPRRGRDDGRFAGDGSLPASTCPQSPEVQT
jgi:hypothetical protein